jgi:ferrous iron transport protein A
MFECRLSQLKKGELAVIKGFDDENHYTNRLQEMGLFPGTMIRLIKYAPLGDPIVIKLNNQHFSLRKALADQIFVSRKTD